MNRIKTTFVVIAFIATSGLVSMAFAQGGWNGNGYGGHMMGNGGYGMGPGMMGYGYGSENGRYGRGAYSGELSKEDINKLQKAQDKFYDETRTLRNQIRDTQFALDDELDRANPDKAKVTELQATLSRIQSEFDQKALAYRLELRKILPENAFRSGYGGHMMGYGSGYGMGPGMMGNGGCNW